MIDKILRYINEQEISSVICTNNLEERLNSIQENLDKDKLHSIYDIRSAVFFAFGIARTQKKPAVVLTESQYISNAYTAMTEAWFQKVPVIIISLEKENERYDYLENCSDMIVHIDREEQIKIFDNMLKSSKPSVVCVWHGDIKNNVYDAADLLKKLSPFLSDKDDIFVGENIICRSKVGTVHEILRKYDYGTVSKYCGFVEGCKGKAILISDVNKLKLDGNVFNNRYVSGKYKIILLKKPEEELKFTAWITDNHFTIIHSRIEELAEEEIEHFMNYNKPSMMILSE